jgi:hypothetical protein
MKGLAESAEPLPAEGPPAERCVLAGAWPAALPCAGKATTAAPRPPDANATTRIPRLTRARTVPAGGLE